ncbi:MAG: hypothetical protein WCI18_09715 [Pseudomonadota bacterium]
MRFMEKIAELPSQLNLPVVPAGKIRRGVVLTVVSACYFAGLCLGYFLIK